MPVPLRHRRDDVRLHDLELEVVGARSDLRALRERSGASWSEHARVCGHLAMAMEAYAEAAAASGVPLPYRYAAELRLCQAMSGSAQGL